MDRIEAIERATLAAVPPQRLDEWGGWLLAFDDGTVGRAHSAVPLRHAAPPEDLPVTLEARYREAGRRLVLRVPEVPAFDGFRDQLHARGYAASKPTRVMTVAASNFAAAHRTAAGVQVDTRMDPAWQQAFLGEGFDPVDAASRLAILGRAQGSLFASVRVQGVVVSVGAAGVAHGWCGLHGLRTLPAWRGRGLARDVMVALTQAAMARGADRFFLQVDAANAAAVSLYAGLGFGTAWTYAYWAKAASPTDAGPPRTDAAGAQPPSQPSPGGGRSRT